jgi:hypothetical protein
MSEIPIPDFTIVKPVLYNYLVNLKDDQEFLSYLIKVERYPFTYKQLTELYKVWCQVGNLDLIKTAQLYTQQTICLNDKHQAIAAKYNQLDLLRYFKKQKIYVKDKIYDQISSLTTAKWINRNYPKLKPRKDSFIYPSMNGYLDVIKYFLGFVDLKKVQFVICTEAAKNGYIDILKDIVKLNKNIYQDRKLMKKILKSAIKNGYIEIVKWVPKKFYSKFSGEYAISNGYLEILQC